MINIIILKKKWSDCMKKILIFGYNMDIGGAENAMLSVINALKDKCEIDLILLEKKGPLLKKIPKEVNVREIKTNLLKYALFRYFPPFRKYIVNKMANKNYDYAVAYMEGRAATFVADLKQDCKKIAWIHNDVNSFDIGISKKEIIDSYSKMDTIVAVSNVSKNSFCQKYAFSTDKVKVVYNLIDEENIIKQANEFTPKKSKFTFVNVSRMRKQKRHDRLLNIAKRLKNDKFDFVIWLIGNGPLEKEILDKIKTDHLEDYVKALGLKENPYPYIKAADYFVMSSDHEGYPLVLLESLLLKTKVISTNVSGASEILKDKYGYIVDINEDALYEKMKEILMGHDKNDFDKNLKEYSGNNIYIIKDLLNLFDLKN